MTFCITTYVFGVLSGHLGIGTTFHTDKINDVQTTNQMFYLGGLIIRKRQIPEKFAFVVDHKSKLLKMFKSFLYYLTGNNIP